MLQSSVRRGEFDRQVVFIKRVIDDTIDTNENYETGWVVVDTDPIVMCKKEDLDGKDVVIEGRIVYVQRTKLTIDYRTDITSQNRAVIDGQVFEIIAVTDDNKSRGVFKTVMCNLLDTEEWST